jgi:hypothetical protein
VTVSSRSRDLASGDRGIYEQLCLLIGHKSANSATTHARLRDQLIATKAPCVITVAGGVGYALCKIAEEPRRISTSRSATLPELGRNLRRVRTAAGLTQTALAKRSGTDRSTAAWKQANVTHRPDCCNVWQKSLA